MHHWSFPVLNIVSLKKRSSLQWTSFQSLPGSYVNWENNLNVKPEHWPVALGVPWPDLSTMSVVKKNNKKFIKRSSSTCSNTVLNITSANDLHSLCQRECWEKYSKEKQFRFGRFQICCHIYSATQFKAFFAAVNLFFEGSVTGAQQIQMGRFLQIMKICVAAYVSQEFCRCISSWSIKILILQQLYI